MVRLKHRYLLVNTLYPDPKTTNVRLAQQTGEDVPYSVQFRQPSSEKFGIQILLRVIREGMAELFGDYGSGKVSASLQSMYIASSAL